MSKITGYNVYLAPVGGGEVFYGWRRTLKEAKALAANPPEHPVPESLYGTARAAGGHFWGIGAPDKDGEAEETGDWIGDVAIVPIYGE